MLESVLKRRCGAWLREAYPGSEIYHLNVKAVAGFPDSLVVVPRPDRCRLMLVEFKVPGKKPTPAQALMLERMQKAGVDAFWVDNQDAFQREVNERC